MEKAFNIITSDDNFKRAVKILSEHLKERGLEITQNGYNIHLELCQALADGAFEIKDSADGVIISASGLIGLLHGAGYYLRHTTFIQGGVKLCEWRGVQLPKCSIRGVYFAHHFHNFYHVADLSEIERYLEDLALWGYNYLLILFPRIDIESEDSPEKDIQIKRIADILKIVRNIGMKTASGLSVNDGYKDYPHEYSIVPLKDELGRHGNSGNMICISKLGAQELIDHYNEDFLQTLSGYGGVVDMVCVWPYDEGGCGCEKCSPWGTNGYIRAAKRAFAVAHKYYPYVVRLVSTWTFDTPYEGEWEGLAASLEKEKWCDVILADSHEDFPRYPLEVGVPGGLPLVNFPEISMWGLYPWGGWGATALPERFTRLWKQTEGKLDGGFLYSEGIYEDINKAVISQLYWLGDVEPDETLAQYARYELGMTEPDKFIKLISMIEATTTEVESTGRCNLKDAVDAYSLALEIDNELADWAKTCWRWRIVLLRTLLDAHRYKIAEKENCKNWYETWDETWKIWLSDDAGVQAAFREIIKIFHCMEVYDGDIYHCRVRPLCD